MLTEVLEKPFLKPEDLVQMGLFKDTGQVFRVVKTQTNIPPYVRLSKKTIRFPREDFYNWILQQTGRKITQLGETNE